MYKGRLENHITFEIWECDNVHTLYTIANSEYRRCVREHEDCDLSLEIWGRVEQIWEN